MCVWGGGGAGGRWAARISFVCPPPRCACQHHVYGTHGFKKGKVAWEFVPTRDSHGDECVCLGAGTKPVTSSAYDGR